MRGRTAPLLALALSPMVGAILSGCDSGVPERRWLEPVILATDQVPGSAVAGAPTLAANSRGEIVTAWLEGTGNDLGVWSRRLVGGSWTEAELVERGYMRWEAPRLVLNEAGVAFSLWSFGSPYPYGWLRGSRGTGAGWEAPQALNDGTEATFPPPQLGVLGTGGAIALWTAQRLAGQRIETSLESSLFDPRSGWAAPAMVGPTQSASDSPRSWSDEAGHAFVLWRDPFGRWVARYLRGPEGWGPELPLPAPAERRYADPLIAVRPSGAIEVLWRETAGGTFPFLYHRIWANRFVPGSGWSELVALDTTARLDCRTALGGDALGALALWDCRTHNIEPTRATWWSALSRNGAWSAARLVGPLPSDSGLAQIAGDGIGNVLATWSASSSGELWAASFEQQSGWGAPAVIAGPGAVIAAAALQALPSGEGLAVWVEGEPGRTQQIRSAQHARHGWREPQDVTRLQEAVYLTAFGLARAASGDAVLVWAENAATPLHPSGVSYAPSTVWSSRFVAR